MPDLITLLSSPESKTLEFKRDLSSLSPILKTLIAFANTAGGTLIIGRDDAGDLLGIEDVFKAEEKLASAIADSIYPALMPEIEVMSIQGKSLLVICVAHWWGPFYLKSKGPREGTFVRLGSTNRIASEEMLEEFKRYRMKVSFDQIPLPDTAISDLDMDQIEKEFAKVEKKITPQKLVSLGILVSYKKKFACSYGGMILFGKEDVRRNYFPTEVRCARFVGFEKSEFIDQYDVEGSILQAMQEVPKFIRRNTKLSAKIDSLQRENIPEYSTVVIREVLTNAFVHADYSIQGMNVKIAIFKDRMEIESPGMLPFGYTLDDFIAGVSHVRNKTIARVFRELHMMEEWGTGYKRISEACQKGGYPIPRWEEVGTSIRVTLYPGTESEKKRTSKKEGNLHFREEEILKILKEKGRLTAKELYPHLKGGHSERLLRSDLLSLKKRDLVKTIGKGRSTYWDLT